MQGTNLLTIFLTGLLTGGLSCMAVQGGLLAATLVQSEEEHLKEKTKRTGNSLPIIAFLIAKLAAYTVLGFILGWLGSLVKLSIPLQVAMQVFVAVFMIGTALNMLNVHPLFRYFIIQPPRFLARLVRKQSKRKDIFAPALLGAFTIFIPCGTTQAMMALAIASGIPILGAAVLFAFVLGTSPVFFVLGYLTTRMGDLLQQRFMKIAAAAIILLALFNLNNAIALSGSKYTLSNILGALNCAISICPTQQNTDIATPTNLAIITITNAGYSPNMITVKRGTAVTLRLVNQGASSCAQAFTVPSLGIQKIVPLGSSDSVSFTAPREQGEIAFMCSMGMYRGTIRVI
jgi:uncharacterized protein